MGFHYAFSFRRNKSPYQSFNRRRLWNCGDIFSKLTISVPNGVTDSMDGRRVTQYHLSANVFPCATRYLLPCSLCAKNSPSAILIPDCCRILRRGIGYTKMDTAVFAIGVCFSGLREKEKPRIKGDPGCRLRLFDILPNRNPERVYYWI